MQFRIRHGAMVTPHCHIAAAILLACAMIAGSSSVSRAQNITEDFNSVPMLTGAGGWIFLNNSQAAPAPGPNSTWFQGSTLQFSTPFGSANSYIAGIYENAGNGDGPDTVSNWLISPTRTLNNGDTLSFWTRSANASASSLFADRLQVCVSTNGGSTDVGSATSQNCGGDFAKLLDINPLYGVGTTYPDQWTQYNVTFTGIGGPVLGRFALRYFVEDGGPGGLRSNYIGIDSLQYTQVPEPSTLALMALAGVILSRRRR